MQRRRQRATPGDARIVPNDAVPQHQQVALVIDTAALRDRAVAVDTDVGERQSDVGRRHERAVAKLDCVNDRIAGQWIRRGDTRAGVGVGRHRAVELVGPWVAGGVLRASHAVQVDGGACRVVAAVDDGRTALQSSVTHRCRRGERGIARGGKERVGVEVVRRQLEGEMASLGGAPG